MAHVTLTKLDAARALLDSALAALLDRSDYVASIVLAGSAENVLQGLLEAQGAQGARAQFVEPIRRLAQKLNPRGPTRRLPAGHPCPSRPRQAGSCAQTQEVRATPDDSPASAGLFVFRACRQAAARLAMNGRCRALPTRASHLR